MITDMYTTKVVDMLRKRGMYMRQCRGLIATVFCFTFESNQEDMCKITHKRSIIK